MATLEEEEVADGSWGECYLDLNEDGCNAAAQSGASYLYVYKMDADAQLPERSNDNHQPGYCLRASHLVMMSPGDSKTVHASLFMRVPANSCAATAP